MQEKQFSEIKVSEICRKAGISRQTFYSLYESKENIVIGYLKENIYSPEAGEQTASGFQLEDFCLQFSHYLVENRDFLSRLSGHGILYLLTESTRQAMLSCDFFLTQLAEDDRQYIAAFIANGFTGIAEAYVERGIQRFICQPLHKIFFIQISAAMPCYPYFHDDFPLQRQTFLQVIACCAQMLYYFLTKKATAAGQSSFPA